MITTNLDFPGDFCFPQIEENSKINDEFYFFYKKTKFFYSNETKLLLMFLYLLGCGGHPDRTNLFVFKCVFIVLLYVHYYNISNLNFTFAEVLLHSRTEIIFSK